MWLALPSYTVFQHIISYNKTYKVYIIIQISTAGAFLLSTHMPDTANM